MLSFELFLYLLSSPASLSRAQVNVLTANGANDRTNANLQEVRLAPATVAPATFGKLGAFPVDGQVYSQVLYVGGLSIPGRGAQNVVFVTTMHKQRLCLQRRLHAAVIPLWHVNFRAFCSVLAARSLQRYLGGVRNLSTPVI